MSFIEFCSGIAIGLSLAFYLNQQIVESLMLGLAGALLLFLTMGDEDP